MQFMYLWLPLIFDVLIMFALSRMNVEDANKKLKAEKGIAADEVTDALDKMCIRDRSNGIVNLNIKKISEEFTYRT